MNMKSVLLLVLAGCITVPGYSMNYPIYGTKRYHRAADNPYYNQYYDRQSTIQQPFPQYGYGHHTHPSHHQSSAHNMRLQQMHPPHSTYDNGYVTDNGYYYYPSHEYHAYGMPTYHGDYKPKSIYYAPRPKYSYYDDREITSNPLDDLQEEILQEDEQERQSELLPYNGEEPDASETWYDEVPQDMPVNNEQDDLANNFLHNLMEYNRQVEENQRLQKLRADTIQTEQHPVEYDEYLELNPDDYQYEPQGEVNNFDIEKYRKEMDQYAEIPKKLLTESSTDMDDEDVRQLKSLVQKHHHEQPKVQRTKDENEHHNEFSLRKSTNNWKQSPAVIANSAQYDIDKTSNHNKYNDYDESSIEYDDDSWINWDRKRSGKRTQFQKSKQSSTTNVALSAPLVKTFTPHSTTVVPSLNQKMLGQKEVVLPRPATPQRQLFGNPAVELIHNKLVDNDDDSSDTIASPSSSPSSLNAIASMSSEASRENKQFLVDAKKNLLKNSYHNKQGDNDESNKRSNVKTKTENIYDTIKQLITMEEELKNVSNKNWPIENNIFKTLLFF